ncbi:MAG TPA: dTMP kinase [Terriglobia bacterium]
MTTVTRWSGGATLETRPPQKQRRQGKRLKSRGFFISFEGIDGTGKSTQFRRLVRTLRRQGYTVCATREPGGTPVGEKVRAILLADQENLSALTELALFYAARAQHLEDVIRPALDRGEVVVSDRFNDCSFAYQGSGRGLGFRTVRQIDRVICGPTQPDLALVLDLDPHLALERAGARDRRQGSQSNRFEAAGLDFQRHTRLGYLALARREPERVRLINAGRPRGEVEAEIRRVVQERLAERSQAEISRSRKTGSRKPGPKAGLSVEKPAR